MRTLMPAAGYQLPGVQSVSSYSPPMASYNSSLAHADHVQPWAGTRMSFSARGGVKRLTLKTKWEHDHPSPLHSACRNTHENRSIPCMTLVTCRVSRSRGVRCAKVRLSMGLLHFHYYPRQHVDEPCGSWSSQVHEIVGHGDYRNVMTMDILTPTDASIRCLYVERLARLKGMEHVLERDVHS